ncbi:MAG TPA: hypothetical protein VES64_03130, partial [Allosphingosinicella sp.]|nr:hypothetical protein [Allosphingosinicella sp.]
ATLSACADWAAAAVPEASSETAAAAARNFFERINPPSNAAMICRSGPGRNGAQPRPISKAAVSSSAGRKASIASSASVMSIGVLGLAALEVVGLGSAGRYLVPLAVTPAKAGVSGK